MAEEQKEINEEAVNAHLRIILNEVFILQGLLPREQSYRGSELEKIDRLVNDIRDKYCKS